MNKDVKEFHPVGKRRLLPFVVAVLGLLLIAVVACSTTGIEKTPSQGQLEQSVGHDSSSTGASADEGVSSSREEDEHVDEWQVFTGTVRRMTIGERVKEIGMEGFDAYNPERPITMLTLDEPQEVHGMSGDGSGDVVSVMLDEVGVRNADELGLEDGAHVSLRTKGLSFPSSSYGAIQRVIGNFELV